MKITIDLDIINELKLSPTEYCAFIIIQKNMLHDYPVGNIVLESLREKGYINNENKIIVEIENKKPDPIVEWVNLWPKGVLPGGYRVSGSVPDCKTRMNTFFKRFPEYTWEVIMEATKRYLMRQQAINWKMTKKNYKFIYDRDGSMLAEECEAVISGEGDKNESNSLFI